MKFPYYVKTILLFTILSIFFSSSNIISDDLKTISRPYDFCLLNGESLNNFSNKNIPIDQLYLYSFNSVENQWRQIPFQIDELYLNLSGSDTTTSYFPEDTTLTLLKEPDNIFNDWDELVFMIKDAGDKADTDNWIDDPVAQQYPRYQITVSDAINGMTKGWIYLFRSTNVLTKSPGYIDYNATQDRIISNFYEIGYDGQTFPKDFVITSAGSGNGQDILDRNRFRLFLRPFGFEAEITDNDIIQDTVRYENPIKIIKGPIRVIRKIHSVASLMGAEIYQLPFTTWYYPYFYRFSKQFPFDEILKFELFRFSFNLNENAKGMKFYSGDSTKLYTNLDILIDGSGGNDSIVDSLSRNKPFWTMATGDPGTMLTMNKIKYFGDENYSWRLYYADSTEGDDISIGDHGIIFTSSSLNVGLHTQNRIYFLKKNFPADSAWIIFDNFNNPISSIRSFQEITSVKEISNSIIPNKFKLYRNYPNPFNPTTNINFDLTKASEVTIAIYNLRGQKVRTLVDGLKEAGSHSIQFDATDDKRNKLPTSIYLYMFRTNEFQEIRKLTLMK